MANQTRQVPSTRAVDPFARCCLACCATLTFNTEYASANVAFTSKHHHVVDMTLSSHCKADMILTLQRILHAGVATSSNGVDWTRVPSASSAAPSATAAEDKKSSGPKGQGCVMQPGEDWWTFDTCHMAVSDVQVSISASLQAAWCTHHDA